MIAPQNDDVIAIVSSDALTKRRYLIRCYVNWAILNDFFTIKRRIVVGNIAGTSLKNILSHEFRWKDTNWWNCKWRRGKKIQIPRNYISFFSIYLAPSHSFAVSCLALNRFVKKIVYCLKYFPLPEMIYSRLFTYTKANKKCSSSYILNIFFYFFFNYESFLFHSHYISSCVNVYLEQKTKLNFTWR